MSIPQVAMKDDTGATSSGANSADQPKKTQDADINNNNQASVDVSIQMEDL